MHRIERFKTITFVDKAHPCKKDTWPKQHSFTLFKEDQYLPFLRAPVFKTNDLMDYEGLNREEDDHASDCDIVWGAKTLLKDSLKEAIIAHLKKKKSSPTKSGSSDDSTHDRRR